MKITRLLIFLCIGLGVGWILGKENSSSRPVGDYSDETLRTLSAYNEVLGELNEREIQQLIEDSKTYAEGTLREIELRYLWEGNAGYAVLKAFEEEGPSEAKRTATLFVERFRDKYDQELQIGEWRKVAEKLYSATAKTMDEPDDADNPVNPPENSKNQLDD